MKLKYKECEECSGKGVYSLPNDDTTYICLHCKGISKEIDIIDIERYDSDFNIDPDGSWVLFEVLEEYLSLIKEETIPLSEHRLLSNMYIELRKKYESQVKANKLLMDNYNGTN